MKHRDIYQNKIIKKYKMMLCEVIEKEDMWDEAYIYYYI